MNLTPRARRARRLLCSLLVPAWLAAPATAQNREDADARAASIEAQMTDAERLSLLVGVMPLTIPGLKADFPANIPPSAGYVPGVPRLGVPAQLATDASLGVANPNMARPGDVATAMPSGLALAASFDPALAARVGATVGRETRAKGFNVLLAGGMNLMRDPRNGRNFEYLGEDPLLAGTLAGHAIRGIQQQGVVSTIKHFALNGQETLRFYADSVIDEPALRESELLAFQLGIEIGEPGAVMCAYNLVNGHKACGNDFLLNQVLKRDWGYKGWVMSDWGAVSDASFFNAGLDQQAGSQLDKQVWFREPLKALIDAGHVTKARVSDAVRRMLRSFFALGIDKPYKAEPIDYKANAQVALEAARAGLVLLKNDGLLPLDKVAKSILVVGGHADFGVLSGGGSSQVFPSNGKVRFVGGDVDDPSTTFTRQVYTPRAPFAALKTALPDAKFRFNSGYSPDTAAAYAAQADVVVVFATKWEGEAIDSGSLALPQGQDELIAKLAAANRNVVVVLETGNPVTMPWLRDVRAIVQAWYPGQEGAQAIAEALTGAINPSGRLPVSFPQSIAQWPRAALPGLGLVERTPVKVIYDEGADAGYRWFAKTGLTPLFPFGHGLSYTRFTHSGAWARHDAKQGVELGVTVSNDGALAGADVPQVYLIARNGQKLQRLVGFGKLALKAGERQTLTVKVDPRLLADYRRDKGQGGWTVPAGTYTFAFGKSAAELGEPVALTLPGQRLKP
ncbi:beta-glucosidase [Roseateles cellulosilyticus]|uniref:Beta-glucosidase n=1 Tax=Pelomonas cellulosilytica TaxID=2906762 RepID=A0ABS8XJ30_9BURK|nr:beta-glucosidase [Pelomonas sp. P8]MCE4552864.1 beta-glucosidase [Pelomonas sp. P8]